MHLLAPRDSLHGVPSIPHEASLELLRHNPYLAAVLLTGTGVDIPADAVATPADGDLSACEPTELRADAMVILHNEHRKRETARACSKTIHTGHPGYDLKPFVIGPDTTPDPTDPANARAIAELTVLGSIGRAPQPTWMRSLPTDDSADAGPLDSCGSRGSVAATRTSALAPRTAGRLGNKGQRLASR
jgi:hypothetical protein